MNNINAFVSITYGRFGHSDEYLENLSSFKFTKDDLFFVPNSSHSKKNFVSLCANNIFLKKDYERKTKRIKLVVYRFIGSLHFYQKLFGYRNVVKNFFFIDYEYLSLILFLLFLKKKSIYVLVHNPDHNGSFLKSLYKRCCLKLLTMKSCNFIVNNEMAMKSSNLIREKTYVINYPGKRYGSNSKHHSKKILNCSGKLIISSIGMLREDKNYEQMIKAFSKSKYSNKDNCILVIAGKNSGVDKNTLKNFFKRYSVENFIVIEKYLSEYELDLYFSASDLLIIPYGSKTLSSSGPATTAYMYDLPIITEAGNIIEKDLIKNDVGCTYKCVSDLTNILNNFDFTLIRDFSFLKKKYSWEQVGIHYNKIANDK